MEHIHVMAGLGVIMGLVLILPFAVKWVEEKLEAFLLVMGLCAVTLSGLWSGHLVHEALREPVKITLAVLLFGMVFRWGRHWLHTHVFRFEQKIGFRIFVFAVVVGLGFLSSVITAIMAALLLVEIVSGLKMERKQELILVVMACFSIGLGAVLTPIGEPLATITIAKLAVEPYHADFFFLTRHMWMWIIPGVLAYGLIAAFWVGERSKLEENPEETAADSYGLILIRAGKVYIFVAALVLLGTGFTPIVDAYLTKMPKEALYWVNAVSAVLDNATLAAAEISAKMTFEVIEYALIALMVAGGMLIPGNIPNIISANKLGITSSEWARYGLPVGAVSMAVFFFALKIVS